MDGSPPLAYQQPRPESAISQQQPQGQQQEQQQQIQQQLQQQQQFQDTFVQTQQGQSVPQQIQDTFVQTQQEQSAPQQIEDKFVQSQQGQSAPQQIQDTFVQAQQVQSGPQQIQDTFVQTQQEQSGPQQIQDTFVRNQLQQEVTSQPIQDLVIQSEIQYEEPESQQLQQTFIQSQQQQTTNQNESQSGIFFDASMSSAIDNQDGEQNFVTSFSATSTGIDQNNFVSGSSIDDLQNSNQFQFEDSSVLSSTVEQEQDFHVQNVQDESFPTQRGDQVDTSVQSFIETVDNNGAGEVQQTYTDFEGSQVTTSQLGGSIANDQQIQSFQVSSFDRQDLTRPFQRPGQNLNEQKPLTQITDSVQDFQLISQQPVGVNTIQTSDIRIINDQDDDSQDNGSTSEFSVPDLSQPQVQPATSQSLSGSISNSVNTRPLPRPQTGSPRRIDSSHCGPGLLADIYGDCVTPEVTRNIFLYAAPLRQRKIKTSIQVPKPKLEYNIVFVRNPEEEDSSAPVIVPPPQRKTLVYVLNKKTKNQELGIVESPSHPPLQPEVFFVNYEDGENPELPGGIDLRTALEEMVLEGTVIGGRPGGDEILLNQGPLLQEQTFQLVQEQLPFPNQVDSAALFVSDEGDDADDQFESVTQIASAYNYN